MFFVLPYSSGAGGSSGLATGSVAAGGVASGAATGAATGAAAALVVLAEATVVVLYNPGYDFLYAVKSGALISSRVTGDLRSSVNRLMGA